MMERDLLLLATVVLAFSVQSTAGEDVAAFLGATHAPTDPPTPTPAMDEKLKNCAFMGDADCQKRWTARKAQKKADAKAHAAEKMAAFMGEGSLPPTNPPTPPTAAPVSAEEFLGQAAVATAKSTTSTLKSVEDNTTPLRERAFLGDRAAMDALKHPHSLQELHPAQTSMAELRGEAFMGDKSAAKAIYRRLHPPPPAKKTKLSVDELRREAFMGSRSAAKQLVGSDSGQQDSDEEEMSDKDYTGLRVAEPEEAFNQLWAAHQQSLAELSTQQAARDAMGHLFHE
jgi:hypothetical protein